MAFNINDFLNAESKKEMKNDWKPVKLSVHKLRPAKGKENFYHMDEEEIEETARSIELVGLQQYPVVKPIEGTDEYEIIAGHKRRLAILKLLEEGKEVRSLLEEWKKDKKLSGRTQDIIAKMLGTSKTKIGTLEHIDNKLITPFKKEFATEKINTSTANKLAGLEESKQEEVYKTYQETGKIVTPKKVIQEEPEQILGQFYIEDYPEVLPTKAAEPIKELERENVINLEVDEEYRRDCTIKMGNEIFRLKGYRGNITPIEEINNSIQSVENILCLLKEWKKEREKGK